MQICDSPLHKKTKIVYDERLVPNCPLCSTLEKLVEGQKVFVSLQLLNDRLKSKELDDLILALDVINFDS